MSLVVGLGLALGTCLMWMKNADQTRVRLFPFLSGRSLLVAISLALLVHVLVKITVLSLLALLMSFWVFSRLDLQQKERAARHRAEAWPDLLEMLVSSIRAGMSLSSAIASLKEAVPEPLKKTISPLFLQLNDGRSIAHTLDAWQEAAEDSVVDRVALALRLSAAVGGRALPVVLLNLASYLRAEARTRAELTARQSWTVNAARLAVAAPWLMVLILGVRARDAYQTPTGSLVLLVGACATWVGYEWMVSLARLPQERRIFA